VQEAEGLALAGGQRAPVRARRFEQGEGAVYVGAHEGARTVDGAVDMALGGEVHHRARLVLGEQALDQGAVADVAMHEEVARVAFQAGERLAVAGVGQRVEVDHRLVAEPWSQSSTKFAPMKPAPPVTRITLFESGKLPLSHSGQWPTRKDATPDHRF
jgi:hypothetical protein